MGNSVNTLRSRNASEKPRHVFREAGLIISSDLCPVTPGSSTRLSTSLQFALMQSAWPIDDQLARARLTKPCPRFMERAEDIVRWCHGLLRSLLIRATSALAGGASVSSSGH